jgi:hypothetical protein
LSIDSGVVAAGLVAAADDDVGAAGGELFDDCPADAAGAVGDQRYWPTKS